MDPHVATCAVCGEPLSAARALVQRADARWDCGAAECGIALAAVARLPPAMAEAQLARERRTIPVRRTRDRERRARVAALLAAEREQDAALAEAVRREADLAATPRTVPLPRGPIAELATDPERVARYAQHLRQLVTAAFARAPETAADAIDDRARGAELAAQDERLDADPALRARCDALCSSCRGSCCSRGGDHAFLTVASIAARRRVEPELTAERAVADYLERIPERSVAGGCINQTAGGCSLPRAWRGDTCNSFYCGPLRAYLADADPERPVLAIQRDHGVWDHLDAGEPHAVVGLALIDRDGIRPLPLPDPAAEDDGLTPR